MRLEFVKWSAFIFACVLVFSGGCDRGLDPIDPSIPAPGTMIQWPLEPVVPENVFKNGDFSEWYAGLNFPTNFNEPVSPRVSQTRRAFLDTIDGEQHRGAVQTWLSSDLQEHPNNQWGTTVDLLEDELYTFRTYAQIESNIVPVVQAWDVNEPNRPRLLNSEVIRLEPGPEPLLFEGTFRTKHGGKTRICSYLTPSSPTEGSVIWYDWQLHRTADAVRMPNFAPEAPPTISNALAQVGKQIELYGENEFWNKRTAHAREVFENMVADLKREKEVVLPIKGGFAIKYNDARFARESGELVIDPSPPMVFRPFWTELVRAQEEFRSRGITLICVPVPHRLNIYPEFACLKGYDNGPLTDGYFYLAQSLLDRGIPIANVASEFLHLKKQGQDVYFKNSSILSGVAHRSLGNSIAATVRGLYPALENGPTRSYGLESIALEIPAIVAVESTDEQRDNTATPTHDVLSILAPDGRRLTLDSASPVLAVGGIAHDYVRYSASWPFHTSQALGWPIHLYDGKFKDKDVLESLLKNQALLSQTKIVVFCFSEEKLLF